MNNTTTSSRKMLEQHNEAITQLLEGNEEDCVRMLLHCLAKAKDFLAYPTPEQPEPEDDEYMGKPSIFDVSLEGVIHSDSEETRVLRDSVGGNVQIYRSVFGTDAMPFIPDQSTLVQFMAVATYNLGMIQHEKASLKCDTKTLAEAQSLYIFSIQLINSSQASGGMLDLTALELALYNNLVHLFAFFLDVEGYAACRQRLASKLALVKPDSMETTSMDVFRHTCCKTCDLIATPMAPAA